MRDASLHYEPGTQAVYATGRYTLIGHALERATGRWYLESRGMKSLVWRNSRS